MTLAIRALAPGDRDALARVIASDATFKADEQAVAERPRLGVRDHEVEHLANVAVVAVGVERPVRGVRR